MKCPKCQRELAASGELQTDGETLEVFQCDECTGTWDFDGQPFETALTFAVGSDGKLYDPESLEPLDLN